MCVHICMYSTFVYFPLGASTVNTSVRVRTCLHTSTWLCICVSVSVYRRVIVCAVNQTNENKAQEHHSPCVFPICLILRLLGTRASARFKSSPQLITNPIGEILQQFHLGNLNYTHTGANSHSG